MNNQSNNMGNSRHFGRIWLASFALAGMVTLLWPSTEDPKQSVQGSQDDKTATLVVRRDSNLLTRAGYATTRPIEQLTVGDRVLAHNPEIRDSQRAAWQEPQWADWLHLSLQMPAGEFESDSEPGLLKIEILRPEAWLRERMILIVSTQSKDQQDNSCKDGVACACDLSTVIDDDWIDHDTSEPLSPLRPIYRDLIVASAQVAAQGAQLSGLGVHLDLPELGASGPAVITDVRSCPAVAPGQGQVVTATFAHPSTCQVLDVHLEGEAESIGVTENHPFWSADRERFVPIGQMEIGERVRVLAGETKRIVSKLPRPGPETVFNLETFGEHVYFVGQDGTLVHNNCELGGGGAGGHLKDGEFGSFSDFAASRTGPRGGRVNSLLDELALDRSLAKEVDDFIYNSNNPTDLLLGLHQGKLVKFAEKAKKAGSGDFHTIGKFKFDGNLRGLSWDKKIRLAMERVETIRWRKTPDLDVSRMNPTFTGKRGNFSDFELFTLFSHPELLKKLAPGFNPFK